MKTRNKVLISMGIVLLILMISAGVYFSWFYQPKNAYDVAWDNKEDISMEAKGIGEKGLNGLEESEVEEIKKEPTIEEIIREVEREKPEFNLTIQPNLVAEYKEYTELQKADMEKVVNKLKSDGEIYPKTIELTEEDIQKLQEYETVKKGKFTSFEDFDKKEAKAWIKDINLASFPYYKKAKVEWFTHPDLIYGTAIGQTGIRGILRLQYFEDENRFKAIANKIYEIDTEIVVSNTDNYDNTISMKLNEILYLSNLREVE